MPKEIRKFIGNKNITTNIYRIQATNIYRIQANGSVMCWYFGIDFTLKGESLLDYSNSSSPNEYEKDDKILLIYF